MNLIPFSLVAFGNLWIWRIFLTKPFIGLVVLGASVFLYLSIKLKQPLYGKLFLALFLVVAVLQIFSTQHNSLTGLTNSDIRVRDMRLKEYPPAKITLLNKTIWIPIAHWFEERPESIAFFRFLRNISEVLDPNLYFFANHPRERVGINEFEKFPFILLPFFIYGTFILFGRKENRLLLLPFLIAIILIGFIGNKNLVGPFALLPLFVVASSFGLEQFSVAYRWPEKFKILFCIFYFLVLLQGVSYEMF